MTRFTAILITAAFGTLHGAALAQGSVDGTWKLSGAGVPKGVAGTATFRKSTVRIVLTGPQGGKTVNLIGTGVYTLKGDAMEMRFSDTQITSKDFTPAQRQQMESPQMRARMRSDAARQNTSGRIKFAGKDKFVLIEKTGKQTTFTRVR